MSLIVKEQLASARHKLGFLDEASRENAEPHGLRFEKGSQFKEIALIPSSISSSPFLLLMDETRQKPGPVDIGNIEFIIQWLNHPNCPTGAEFCPNLNI